MRIELNDGAVYTAFWVILGIVLIVAMVLNPSCIPDAVDR